MRAARATFLAALALSGCASPLHPIRVEAENWSDGALHGRRLLSDHFEIISTINDADFEAALPGFMEVAFEQYSATLPAGSRGDKMTVYLLATRQQWERFTRQQFPGRAEVYRRIHNGGYSEGGTAVAFYTHRSATLATLAHEGWHQYVATRLGFPIPAWLNEGLACYHEAVEWVGDAPRFTPQHNTFRIASLREAVHTGKLLSLEQLIDADAGEILRRNDSRLTQAYYAQSWALILFLRASYPDEFERLLDLSDGTFRVRQTAATLTGSAEHPTRAIFEMYFGCTPQAAERAFTSHLHQVAGL